MRGFWTAVVIATGCGGHPAQAIDAAVDGELDAIDAAPDAPPDGPPEIGRRITGIATGVRGPFQLELTTAVTMNRQRIWITEDGPFQFVHLLPDQSSFTVVARQAAPCGIHAPTVTVSGQDVTDLLVVCDGALELASVVDSIPVELATPFDREASQFAGTSPFLVGAADLVAITPTLVAPLAGTKEIEIRPDAATAGVMTLSGQPQNVPLRTGWTIRVTYRILTTVLRSRDYAFAIAPRLLQEGYLKAMVPIATASFSRVAISGDRLVVGAPGDSNKGAAFVFHRTGATWAPEATLTASNGLTSDLFGDAVAIDGDTVIVGAPSENTSAADSGAVYVFTRNGTQWTQQTMLKAGAISAGDSFGASVAISGGTIAIGVASDDGPTDTATDCGAVYVFTGAGATWTQQGAALRASNAEAGDLFGSSVSLSADTLAVGARFEDSALTGVVAVPGVNNAATEAGAAYVFVRQGTAWSQQAYLKASNTAALAHYGAAIAADGDVVAVSAVDDGGSGGVYVYRRAGTTWSFEQYLKAQQASAGDSFGASIGLRGNNLIVGVPREDGSGIGPNPPGPINESLLDAGAVYVFRHLSAWTPVGYIKASNPGAQDRFGTSVAVDGATFAGGASGEASNSATNQLDNSAAGAGAVYVFR